MTKNITLSVDDEVLAKVRRIAAEKNTTVNGLVREYLTDLASREDRAKQAVQRLKELSENSGAELGPDWRWNREELYDSPVFSRHEHTDLCGGGEGERARKTGKVG